MPPDGRQEIVGVGKGKNGLLRAGKKMRDLRSIPIYLFGNMIGISEKYNSKTIQHCKIKIRDDL